MNTLKARHIEQLQQMGLVKSFRWLRALENRAHWYTTQYCENPRYTSAMFEDDKLIIEVMIRNAFGGTLPNGFFINNDPRGYALKIDDSVNTLPCKDWGGYGILAPDFKEYK